MEILLMRLGHLLISARQSRRQRAQTSRQARAAEPDTEPTLPSEDQGDIL
jgi:hypothetical protein